MASLKNKTFPNYEYILENPNIPGFYKHSIEKKTEALVSFVISDKIDFDEYCNLKNFKNYFDRLNDENKIIKYLNFDSIDCLTDSVFYILFKYFNKNDMWKILDKITLDSCRFITDFGIDLMKDASGTNDLIHYKRCTGCTNIFSHFFKSDKNDIFQNKLFGYLNLDEPNSDLNIFKILVLNVTNASFISLLTEKKTIPKISSFEYEKIFYEKKIFNIFELDSLVYQQVFK